MEIAARNFNDGVLLYLISGSKSIERANKENLNINDNNGFIYISIDDFINAKEIQTARDIYNDTTKKLLKVRRPQ